MTVWNLAVRVGFNSLDLDALVFWKEPFAILSCVFSPAELIEISEGLLHLGLINFCQLSQLVIRSESKTPRLVEYSVPRESVVPCLIVIVFTDQPVVICRLGQALTACYLTLNLLQN